jgi:Ca2+:H+ antiporter
MAEHPGNGVPADDEERHLLNEPEQGPRSSRPRPLPLWLRRSYTTSQEAFSSSNSHALLLCVPLTICSHFLGWPALLTIILSVAAIVPISALVSHASEKLSDELGDVIGALISATFGNAVELSVSTVNS